MPTSQEYLAGIKKGIRELTPQEVKARLDGGVKPLVIDVREKEETDGGILPGAKTLVRGFLELKIESVEPNRDREIIIYCAGGNRSALGAKALQDLGYKKVFSMKGGYGAWQHAGLPIEQKK